MAFCSNCGKILVNGAKFCFDCGTPVQANTASQRITVYDGELHKCPNCGGELSAFVVACPFCGHELRGTKASNSVREFASRLSEIESDEKRIISIQSFPIPNNKEDILEFMILATTCFDVNESLGGTGIKKDISNAWLAKVEQCYRKAKLVFTNDTSFCKIQSVYDETHDKIRASADKEKRRNFGNLLLRTIGVWGGLILLIISFMIEVTSRTANTAIFDLGGGIVMIIGALATGKKSSNLIDAGIGIGSGVLALLLGMLLTEKFNGNGAVIELSGIIVLIITVIQLIRHLSKK